MKGNSLERQILLRQPRIWVLQLGGVHLNNSGLYLPQQWTLHMKLSRDLQVLPGLVLTTALVMFRLKPKESLWSDSFSKTAPKVLSLTSKQPSARQSRFLQQNKAAKRTRQNRSMHWACLHPSTCLHYNAFEFKARQAQKY